MSDLPDMLAHLSPEQQELFRLRLARLHKDSAPPAVPPITPQPRTGASFPLSFGQQRLWFLDQLMPGQLSYTVPLAVQLRGRLDRAALERSLQALVARHETLRTTFAQGPDRQPLQVIAAAEQAEVALPLIDLRDWPAAERHAEAQRRATAEIRRPFDLQAGPLLRPTLLQLDEHEHWLILAMHHIISDQWSLGVLVRELGALYQAASADPGGAAPLRLPEPPIQYADYAVWQREWLRDEVLEQQLSYWREQLADLTTLELPTDSPRPAVQSFRGAAQALTLPRSVSVALQALSQHESATLFMTLLAAFQLLLHRYSGQDDIAVGSPIANRTQAATEGVIGFFVNTLVLRADLSGNPSFRELLRRVRRVCLQAYRHQDLPFEMAVEVAQARRDLSRNPLFQVSFVLLNTPIAPLRLPELELAPLELQRGATQFDITLSMIETPAGLRGRLEYTTDLFSEATISRLLSHFSTLLQAIAVAPDQPISALPLLSAAERQQLLGDWNATAVPVDLSRPAHVRFAQQAARTPDAVAVSIGEEQLSYRELHARSQQLAHALQQQGVGPESRVGLFFQRSPELVVALLGVLQAGAAYLPLDLSAPAARLQFILRDAQVPLVLTHAPLVAQLPASAATVLDLDAAWPAIAAAPTDGPLPVVAPEQLAYLIYTSGSTGQPKGAMITHGGLTNYLQWAVDAYRVADGSGAPVHSPLGFDLTVTSLWTPLLAGRSVRLLPEGQGIETLTAALAEGADYSLVKITPAHLEVLRHALKPEGLAAQTRAFVIGGEQLLAETLTLWREHAPQTRLINEYGPTETVVGCCVYDVAAADASAGAVPIGRPIANTQLYILDAQLQPVPQGVAGELYIGGHGLARGYLNRPALTAEKFVPNPFADDPGTRLYRTGDLARYRADGVLEYLGRIDGQVKLRGFRIELGEIESVLTQHPQVREAVVLVREDSPGDKRLVAYVVGAEPRTENQEPSSDEAGSQYAQRAPVLGSQDLRDFLKTRLPEYMLPSAFLVLDELPLTGNGKVDRKRLPAPDQQQLHSVAYVAPRSEIEATVAAIWAEVLGVSRVGIYDNFFALGGHSLLAVKAIAGLQERCQVELPLRRIFEAPTVAELAAVVVETQAGPASAPIERLDRGPSIETLATLDQLSADDVDALLSQMLADKV